MIYLVGFSGVGKTTIGKKLSDKKNINFIDTDEEIEKNEGSSIVDIFNFHGEKYFRELEMLTLRKISDHCIVSCGGGLPIFNRNMQYINEKGKSIYLKSNGKALYSRVKKNIKSRPNLIKINHNNLLEYIEKNLVKREKIYSKAHFTIDTSDLSINEVLRKIDALPISF